MARRKSVGHGIRRFPSVLTIAHNRIGGEVRALHIHLERFHASLDERSAYFAHLLAVSAAHEAILILNNGVPRKEAFERLEAEFEAAKACPCRGTGLVNETQDLADGASFTAEVACGCKSDAISDNGLWCERCFDSHAPCADRKAA